MGAEGVEVTSSLHERCGEGMSPSPTEFSSKKIHGFTHYYCEKLVYLCPETGIRGLIDLLGVKDVKRTGDENLGGDSTPSTPPGQLAPQLTLGTTDTDQLVCVCKRFRRPRIFDGKNQNRSSVQYRFEWQIMASTICFRLKHFVIRFRYFVI